MKYQLKIDVEIWAAFKRLCQGKGTTAAAALRQLIRKVISGEIKID